MHKKLKKEALPDSFDSKRSFEDMLAGRQIELEKDVHLAYSVTFFIISTVLMQKVFGFTYESMGLIIFTIIAAWLSMPAIIGSTKNSRKGFIDRSSKDPEDATHFMKLTFSIIAGYVVWVAVQYVIIRFGLTWR